MMIDTLSHSDITNTTDNISISPHLNTDIEKPINPIEQFSEIQSPTSEYITVTNKNKYNKKLYTIIAFLFIWICYLVVLFVKGILKDDDVIISEGFFNSYRFVSFVITLLSLIYAKKHIDNEQFITKRIELIASLASVVSLLILSAHMCIHSIHLVTEEEHHIEKIRKEFMNIFYIIKIGVNVIVLIVFYDCAIHPSHILKFKMWKESKQWKKMEDVSFHELKENINVIKKWDNHRENIHSFCVYLKSDIFSSLSFIIFFNIFNAKKYFGWGFMVIAILHFTLVIFMCKPIFHFVLRILMQGKSEIFSIFYEEISHLIQNTEGVIHINELKIWMKSHNDIKGCTKLLISSTFNRSKLKNEISALAAEIGIQCEFIIEASQSDNNTN